MKILKIFYPFRKYKVIKIGMKHRDCKFRKFIFPSIYLTSGEHECVF